MNRCVLIGRLGREPEIRFAHNGTVIGSFSLAVPRVFAKDETDWFNVVCFKQTAEFVKNLNKGDLVAVDGRVQVRKYEDQSGTSRIAVEVVADNVRGLSPKSGGDDHGPVFQQRTDTSNRPAPDEFIDPFAVA